MTFRPTLWATVAAAVVLAVLVGLGNWQLDRRSWKKELLETRARQIDTPAMSYAAVVAAAHPALEAVEYRPIRLRGRYRPANTAKLLSRTRDGRAGFHLITPLEENTAGVVVLVDRGWVPVGSAAEISPTPAGLVSVEGYVRKFETPGRFTPDNEPEAGAWFYLDREQMASAMDLAMVAPFYVQRAPSTTLSGGYPAGGVPDIALRNPHLQYAITWYALALVLLVIYVIFHTRRRVGEDE
ncbi:MAG: SURF1 family protein [Alphaproteobacteria bacterium]|nr:SURF1 family protein [Alphaproteobacteria bacterium]